MKDRDLFEQKILKRVAIVLWLIIFLVLLIAFILNGSLNNFQLSVYKATTLITQIYIQDSGSVSSSFIFLLGFIGKVLVIYIIYILILLFNEGMFRDSIREAIIMRRVKEYKNHYIIAGGGRVGSSVASVLKAKKKQFVIIEKNPELVLEHKEHRENVIEGDSLDEELLTKLGIKRAKVFISTLGNDGDNIMQIITAKRLNPKIKIVVRANYPQFIDTMKKFGATEVIMPEKIGGEFIAQKASSLN